MTFIIISYVHFVFQYGSEAYNVEYPGEVDVNVGLSPGDIFCSYVTVENSSCTVNITEDREYSIVISMENSVGTTVTVYPFKCELHYIIIGYLYTACYKLYT